MVETLDHNVYILAVYLVPKILAWFSMLYIAYSNLFICHVFEYFSTDESDTHKSNNRFSQINIDSKFKLKNEKVGVCVHVCVCMCASERRDDMCE